MVKKLILKIALFIVGNFILLNLAAQKNTFSVCVIGGTSNSPSGYWGVGGYDNLSKKIQIGTGFGFTFASGHKISADLRYYFAKENEITPLLCLSYSYLLKGSKDYGEGLNDKRNFKYSAGSNLAAGGGLNINLTKSIQNINRQIDILIIGGYSKLLNKYNIVPVDPVNYNRDDFDAIEKNLFKSTFYFNIGINIQID